MKRAVTVLVMAALAGCTTPTDRSDAVRDDATAIKIAAQFCGAKVVHHWHARLEGNAWHVTTDGIDVLVDKKTGQMNRCTVIA
jgi:hypothetical protein